MALSQHSLITPTLYDCISKDDFEGIYTLLKARHHLTQKHFFVIADKLQKADKANPIVVKLNTLITLLAIKNDFALSKNPENITYFLRHGNCPQLNLIVGQMLQNIYTDENKPIRNKIHIAFNIGICQNLNRLFYCLAFCNIKEIDIDFASAYKHLLSPFDHTRDTLQIFKYYLAKYQFIQKINLVTADKSIIPLLNLPEKPELLKLLESEANFKHHKSCIIDKLIGLIIILRQNYRPTSLLELSALVLFKSHTKKTIQEASLPDELKELIFNVGKGAK